MAGAELTEAQIDEWGEQNCSPWDITERNVMTSQPKNFAKLVERQSLLNNQTFYPLRLRGQTIIMAGKEIPQATVKIQ